MSDKKKTPDTGKVSRAEASSNAARDSSNDTVLPVKLPPEVTQKLLNQLSEGANQARRFIVNLSRKPDSPTGHLSRDSGVNLSAVASRCNPLIRPFGYYLACRYPPEPILNARGEKSGQQLWGIYRVNGAS